MTPEQIKDTLQRIVGDLSRIQESESWDYLTQLPKAHPEMQTIMGDCQHCASMLKLRVKNLLVGWSDGVTSHET